MKCPDCKAEMKALFTTYYCPNECDTPEGKKRNEELRAKQKAWAAMWSGFLPPGTLDLFN